MIVFVSKSSRAGWFCAVSIEYSAVFKFYVILRGFHEKLHLQTYGLAKDSLGDYQTTARFIKQPQEFR